MELKRNLLRTINETVAELESKSLKPIAKQSLTEFAEKEYAKCLINLGVPTSALLLTVGYLKSGANFQSVVKPYLQEVKELKVYEIGQQGQEYDKTYFERVKQALDELAKGDAQFDEGVSLRNIAEMTVRYDKTMKSIEDFKKSGVNLVQSSEHANCSKRCEPWQGGHYTLDGTYRVVDGIEFQPLENATDQYVITKKGKVYKNGHITGYNCRHYLIAYEKGRSLPHISRETIEHEREADRKMRAFERQIRGWKDKAEMYKGIDKEAYLKAKAKAQNANEKYIEFAKENKRAYYPTRTKII